MSKRFKEKTCTYCGALNASQTGDHVFARELFPVDQRGNLPQVPACLGCNADKSKLEHYLTSVLPFGGQHPASPAMLESMVPPRLANNAKLHRKLAAESEHWWVSDGSLVRPAMTLPFDGEKLEALFRFVVRGLVAHHWNLQIPQNYFVEAGTVSADGERFFSQLMALNARERVAVSLGAGLIDYEGVQGIHNPYLTIWRFTLYGGIQLSGDPRLPGQSASRIWASTSRNPVLQQPEAANQAG